MQDFFASCPKGLELLLRDELVALGAQDAREALAGVHFSGPLELAYRACLWSRLASRVLLRLAEFAAPDADALYAGVDGVDWSVHLAPGATLAIDAVGSSAGLSHSGFIALRAKDAVVDQLRVRHGWRPDIDPERPSVRLNLRLHRGRATLSLDLAGVPLHRRGWRQEQGEAPLKENLAAAMLLRAGWPAVFAAGGALVDPMCGAGTLLIEGAWMAADVAPGLQRDYFGLLGWRGHDGALWERLREEARERAERGLRALPRRFFGQDVDPGVLQAARRNAQAAGVEGFVQLARQAAEHLEAPSGLDAPGLVICNPPYGERLGERASLGVLYRSLGDRLRAGFPNWRAAIIVAEDALGHALGLRADRRYTLFNGALECRLLIFDPIAPPARERIERPLSAGGQAVANRLAKNLRHLRRRLAREGIGCYRIYDADLPEYAAAIDVYTAIGRDEGTHLDASEAQVWLHLQEYAPPREIPEHVARERLGELVRAAMQVFELPRARIAIKTRRRGKGGSKYGRFDQRNEFLVVEEGGLRLRVNLFDYLDTGLFLDHRPLRARSGQLARGQRFLNLFAYTGTASVHAAAGGALTTTSVDLSATYLEWAARNFGLNDIGGPAHQLVQADVLEWLRHDRGQYDLIFVDPPSFSNSKRAEDFDVQRDHAELLRLCGTRLARGGLILFSNNLRRFTPDVAGLAGLHLNDITAATVPFDFARATHVHHAFELRPG